MSELGFKVIKHNNWLGSSSSEDEEKQQKFKQTKELKKKEMEQECETNEEKDNFKGKVQSYDEAIALIEKYKDKKLSLKLKALVKKAKKLIKRKNEETASSQGKTDQERFSKGSSIFDTKKGQVLFELQKSYKGDSRFKLDERFAEDIEADKLPNSIKLLTTGIDFKNLSDGSDTEFKSNSRKQKKIARKEEKMRSKEIQVEREKVQETKDSSLKRGFYENERDNSDDEEEEFFVKKVINKEEDQNSSEEENDDDDDDEVKVDEDNTINPQDEKQQFMTEEEIYGQRFRENDDRDFIDQEGLESDVDSIGLPDELNGYLRILQDLLPEDKLFFQNKRKNLKIVNNSFAGYGTMLSKQEQMAVESKNKKKKSQKQDENQEEDADSLGNKKNSSKEADENDDKIKKEKSYNLVIPRFDPSQLIVKKVMETQEKERNDKIKEKQLGASKKEKKIKIEAKIEAGIDKKAQKIIKANSILDKNLGEHQKLEGITVVKRKAPVLKKLKIDLDKWKNIIQSSMQAESTNERKEQPPSEQEQSHKTISQDVQLKQVAKLSQNISQKDKSSNKNNSNNNTNTNRSSAISTNLGFLFATAPSTVDPSRNQFKLFK